jgi:YD repeat-containing protein
MKRNIHRLLAFCSLFINTVCVAGQYVYDDNNQLTRVIYPTGREVTYAYDPAGNLLSISVTNRVSAPVILAQPVNQSVAAQGAASFSVFASGTEPLAYEWRFNGGPIVGATNDLLTILHVQAADAGSYTVLVTNSAGWVVSEIATLVVTPLGLSLAPGLSSDGSHFTLRWTTTSGWTYEVQYCSALAALPNQITEWHALQSGIQGTGGIVEVTDSLTQNRRYYRLVAVDHP